MRSLRAFGLAALVAALAWLACAGAPAAAEAPALEERERQIAADLRCPVCQNLSVADSPSPLAQEMRALIREQLQQGKNPEEVRAYFVSKYGEWVLLAPKPSGFNLLAYAVPLLAGAAGVLGVLLAIRRWVRRRQAQVDAAPEISAADRERLLQTLAAAEEEEEDARLETVEAAGPLAELEAQRAALHAGLRELDFDREAGMISEEDHAAMRRRYEAEAVGIMRRLDALLAQAPARGTAGSSGARAPAASAPAGSSRGAPTEARRRSTREGEEAGDRGARASRRRLWVAGGVVALGAFGVASGVVLTRSVQPRPEGGNITGGPLAGASSEASALGPAAGSGPAETGQPGRPLDPATLARMLQAARAALDAGRFAEAAAASRAVLERDPGNVEAITHMGNILERSGEGELALGVYDKALAIDPRSLRALWDKGHLLFQRADYAGAIQAWQAFFEAAPPGQDRDYVERRMADARARLTASGPVPPPAPKGPAGAAQPVSPRTAR